MGIMVTGGRGFLGQTLVSLLQLRGEKVISYDRRAEETIDSNLIHVQGDLADLPTLLETVRKYNVEKIIHTAAISHPVASREIPYQTVITNAVGTTNVFEAARLCDIKRVVNLSSECAYGNNDELGIVKEDSLLNPTTPYGATKVFTEKLANVYTSLYDMEIPSLRPGWLYGPGQFMQCYMKTLLRNAIDNVPTREETGRDYRFQYVHVKDVARACILAMDTVSLHHNVYNITGGTQISYEELTTYVKEIYPTADISIGPGTIDILDMNSPFDITRAKEDLGYIPEINLSTGIYEYAKWLEKYPF